MRFPRRNLGAGEQWGREVENAISAAQTTITRIEEADARNNQQINSTINRLSGLVDELQSQQAELAAQQDVLQDQQNQILEVVRNQIKFVANYGNFNGPFNISAGGESLVGYGSLVVPAGYTNVTISLTSNVGLVNPLSSTSSAAARSYIEWPDGSESFSAMRYQSAGAGWDLALAPTLQRSRTGLSGGQTIRFRFVMRALETWPVTPGGYSYTYQAVFTRDV